MKYIFFAAFLLFSVPSLGQLPHLKEGIYNSFYNFKENRPLPIRVEYHIAGNEQPYKSAERIYLNSDQIRLDTNIKIKKRSYQRRNMWGFYNGQNFYINSKAYAETVVTRYSRILGWGRYAWFIGAQDIYHKSAFMIGGLIGTIGIQNYMVLDTRNGDIVKLTPEFVKNILQEHPDLLEQFQQEKEKDVILIKYLDQYNQLHASENFKE